MAKIAFLGDSITKGTDYGGVTQADTFATLVGVGLGYDPANIINAGISGNTTVSMASRFQTDVVARGATVCAVMGMFNDIAQLISVTDYSNALRSIASQASAAHTKCVFVSPPVWRADEAGHARNREYVYAMERVAAEEGCLFIDCYRNYAFDYLCSTAIFLTWYAPNDALHQSKAGHVQLSKIMLRSCFAKCWEPLPAVSAPAASESVSNMALAIARYLVNGQNPADLLPVSEELNKFS